MGRRYEVKDGIVYEVVEDKRKLDPVDITHKLNTLHIEICKAYDRAQELSNELKDKEEQIKKFERRTEDLKRRVGVNLNIEELCMHLFDECYFLMDWKYMDSVSKAATVAAMTIAISKLGDYNA